MRSTLLSGIHLHRSRRASLQSQLVSSLKAIIHEGRLPPGAPVPSSRALSADLGLSRNTVLIALDQLTSEGYLAARPRTGLFVSPDFAAPPSRQPAPLPPPKPPRPTRLMLPLAFRPCQPDVRLFPMAMWNRMRSRALKLHGAALLGYQTSCAMGLPALQRVLATYLRDSRGVSCHPDQIAITNGSQQALFLLSLLMVKPGARVYLEDPGYFGAQTAFALARAKLKPLAVDAHGLVPPARLARGSLLYTTPSRQFPTGATLPVSRRMAILQAAAAGGAWIIEDDYDSEFRYGGRSPVPSLHSLDRAACVIYLGTISKVLSPALRIGYLVLPETLVDGFARLRTVADDHGPLISQAVLAEFIASGSFYSHLRRCRKDYAARLDTFLTTAAALALPLEFPHADGGMNLHGSWTSPPALSDDAISNALLAAGLDVPPIGRYALRSKLRGLVFGYTSSDHAAIRLGLKRLAEVFRALGISPAR